MGADLIFLKASFVHHNGSTSVAPASPCVGVRSAVALKPGQPRVSRLERAFLFLASLVNGFCGRNAKTVPVETQTASVKRASDSAKSRGSTNSPPCYAMRMSQSGRHTDASRVDCHQTSGADANDAGMSPVPSAQAAAPVEKQMTADNPASNIAKHRGSTNSPLPDAMQMTQPAARTDLESSDAFQPKKTCSNDGSSLKVLSTKEFQRQEITRVINMPTESPDSVEIWLGHGID